MGPRAVLQRILGVRPPPAIYLGDHTLLARAAFGAHIYLDSRDTSLTPAIAATGQWEPDVARIFARTVRPGMRVVDVGANCGFYAVMAAGLVGPKGSVVAIDANPRMVSLMRRSIAANAYLGRARAVHGAVMAEEGEVEIGVPDEFMGSASILVRDGEHAMAVTTIKAPGRPLAAFLDPGARVDVLKLDAEGAEPLIVRGAEDVIRANPSLKIFMEWAPPMQGALEPPAEFLARLKGLGLELRLIERGGRLAECADEHLLGLDWAELLLWRSSTE